MSRSYQDIVPDYQYRTGEVQDIIEFHVKDFKKVHLKVHYSSNGVIKVSGERPAEGTKWLRFRREFNLPKDHKANEIHARMSSGILYVTIPKKVPPHALRPDPLAPPLQRASTPPVQDKGKLEQAISSPIQSQSKEAADTVAAKQAEARDVMTPPNENATLPKASPKDSPKSSISRLKMERKTVLKVAATVTVLALLFTMLFYGFKFYAPMIMHA